MEVHNKQKLNKILKTISFNVIKSSSMLLKYIRSILYFPEDIIQKIQPNEMVAGSIPTWLVIFGKL